MSESVSSKACKLKPAAAAGRCSCFRRYLALTYVRNLHIPLQLNFIVNEIVADKEIILDLRFV